MNGLVIICIVITILVGIYKVATVKNNPPEKYKQISKILSSTIVTAILLIIIGVYIW